jgi:DNA-binding transcriptional MerR regulator
MRISELSRQSDLPVATIKYYLREGLLPPGLPTSATQARYDEAHLRRLRLIRALSEVGGLSLVKVRAVLDAVDDPTVGLHETLSRSHYALAGDLDPNAEDPDWAVAHAEVDALLEELGWRVHPRAPARDQLAHALLTLRRLDAAPTRDALHPYADAAHGIATHEIATLAALAADAASPVEVLQQAVIGTVLYEPVILALRRLAQEHESARQLAPSAIPPDPGWSARSGLRGRGRDADGRIEGPREEVVQGGRVGEYPGVQ